MFTLLLPLMIMSDPVPIAGRPVDFSGAVGGPFVVTMSVDKTEVKLDEPIKLTITITGPGDLSKVKRPDLTDDPRWTGRFVIDNGPTQSIETPPSKVFDYFLRTKSRDWVSLPPIRFVYFNPAIQPANKGWQTTTANNVKTITVRLPEEDKEQFDNFRQWQKRMDQQTRQALTWTRIRFNFFQRIGAYQAFKREFEQLRDLNMIERALQQKCDAKSFPGMIQLLARLAANHPNDVELAEGLELARKLVDYGQLQEMDASLQPEQLWWPRCLLHPIICLIGVGAWAILLGLLFWKCLPSRQNKGKVRAHKCSYSWGIIILGLVAALPLANQLVIHLRANRNFDAMPVVIRVDTDMNSGNGESYSRIARLPRGAEAREITRRGDWVQIEFASGLIGWVPDKTILNVFPKNAP